MFEYDYVSGDCVSISLGRLGKTFLSDVRSTGCGGFAFLASGFCPDSLVNRLLKSEDT